MSTKTGIGDRPETIQEEDLRFRNTKKIKGGSHEFTNDSSHPLSYADLYADMEDGGTTRKSYKETVLGISAGSGSNGDKATSSHDEETPGDEYGLEDMRLEIVEKRYGGHECPEIVVPPHAEERLCRPWRQGLLVKLLGRRIGYKALENRLNQMWVAKGVMNIIDLGSEFYLVYLSSQHDYNHALTNGPWLIYDHYLTVREWRPNFRPEKEEINRVAVWVRLPELPVEYYDPDFLDFLGNRIGRTVKVDKTTQEMARGKYARLCVEIDLDAPLLAMFEIKGHIYKIEYEGLHLLCMACGRFGHHKDQCTVKEKNEIPSGEGTSEHSSEKSEAPATKKVEDGPWKIVQKQRWPRKTRDKGGPAVVGGGRVLPATINGNPIKKGSRFDILSTNAEDLETHNEEDLVVENNEEDLVVENNEETIIANNDITHSGVNANASSTSQPGTKRMNQAGVKEKINNVVRGPRVNDKSTEKETIATESNASQVRGIKTASHVAILTGEHRTSNGADPCDVIQRPSHDSALDKPVAKTGPGPVTYHVTRPPDTGTTPSIHTPNFSSDLADIGMMDSDEFMDANEQGTVSDSDMEVVLETAPSSN